MTVTRETCWICGSGDSETVLPRAWESLYRRCKACGHQVELSSDYRERGELYYEDDSHLYFSPFAQWLSAGVARQRIDTLKQHLKSGHVLEIGPGTGEVILAARRGGYAVSAVESSNVFASHLRSKTDASLYQGSFEDFDLGRSTFDGVLSFHVLEHVMDPVSHLRRILDVTRPGGYLVLATPNASSLDRRLCGPRWTGYSMGHVNLFSLTSIRPCLEQAGWKVLRISTVEFAWELIWSIKSGIKPKKTTPQTAGSNVKRIPVRLGALAFTLFGALTRPVRFVQERLNGGNEILVVAQRDTQ